MMTTRFLHVIRPTVATTLAVALALTACGDDDTNATDTGGASTSAAPATEADEAAIIDVLTASHTAELAGDGAAFVAHWTDRGLEQYGLGTREEILAQGLQEDRPGEVVGDPDITVTGDEATVAVNIESGIGLYRIDLALIRDGDSWLLDGLEFLGGSAAPPGMPVVDVRAVDFAFGFDRSQLASGNFSLDFENTGTQQHEMALFRVPDAATVAEAATALATVDGSSYEGVPTGYAAIEHLAYAEPGQNTTFTLARPLDAGHYVLVCYIPDGGLDPESGQPVDPQGLPHIAKGMIADFTVD